MISVAEYAKMKYGNGSDTAGQNTKTISVAEYAALKDLPTVLNTFASKITATENDVSSASQKYMSDSGTWYKGISKSSLELMKEKDNIQSLIEKYRNYLDNDTYASAKLLLHNSEETIRNSFSNAKKVTNIYSRYNSEGEYNQAVVAAKYYNASYDELNDIVKNLTDRRIKQSGAEGAETQKQINLIKNLMYTKEYASSADYDSAINMINEEIKNAEARSSTTFIYKETGGGKVIRDNQDEIDQLKRYKTALEQNKTLALREERIKKEYEPNRTDAAFSSTAELGGDRYSVNTNQSLDGIRDDYLNNTQTNPNAIYENKLAMFIDIVNKHPEVLTDEHWTVENNGFSTFIRDYVDGNYQFITEDELMMYNYLFEVRGYAVADKYLNDLKVILDKRGTEYDREEQKKVYNNSGWLGKVWLNIKSVPQTVYGNIGAGVEDIANMIIGNGVNPYSPAHDMATAGSNIRNFTSESIQSGIGGNFGKFVANGYQAVMSGADSVFGGLTLGSTGYGIAMGLGATSQKAAELYERGVSNTQLAAGAITSGIIEGIFEKFSIDKLTESFLKNLGKKGFKNFLKSALVQGGVEASEEFNTEIANIMADSIINGYGSVTEQQIMKYINEDGMSAEQAKQAAARDNAIDVFWAAYGGFVSGSFLGGGGFAIGSIVGDSGSDITGNKSNTNKVTPSAELQKVLDKLANNEDVSLEELENIKQIADLVDDIDSRPETYNINTPERATLREKIIDKLIENGSATIDSNGKVQYNGNVKQEHRADIVIGLPAAGKSSVLVDPLSEQYSSRVIDSDMAKEMLPEYDNGMGANAVHRESQNIIEEVLVYSVKNGDNIVWPIVGGGNVNKLINKIQSLKDNGYSVYLHLNELPNNKALGRSLNRFLETGRFISPDIIKGYGDTPTQNFNTIINTEGLVDGYSHYSNDVGRGESPTLIKASGSDGEFDERRSGLGSNQQENTTAPGRGSEESTGSRKAGINDPASFMPENESVLPDVSAADGETDSYEAFTKRYNGTLELTEDQKLIQSICKALGNEAVFENLDRWVTGKDGKRRFFRPDGYFDKATGKIHINTSTNGKHNPLLFVIKHELTHFTEIDQAAYTEFANGIMDSAAFKQWVKAKGFNSTLDMNADYVHRYAESGLPGTENFDEGKANLEMVADFVAENLFVNDMTRLKNALSNVQPKATNKFKQLVMNMLEKLKNVFSKMSSKYIDIRHIEYEFIKTCQSAQKAWEQKNATKNEKISGVSGKEYLIAHDETFARYCDSIDQIEVNDDISQKGQYVEVSQQTPSIIVEKANAKDLPMAILFDTAYLETRHDGKLLGNYHNLGADNMKNLPKLLETPEYIVKLTNGRLNVVVDMGTSKGKQTLVSIELDQSKQVNGKFNQYNLIITAFSAKSGYLDKIVNNPDNKVLYNKKAESQGTDQLHKGLDGINDSASNNRVAQNEPSVNSNSTQDSKEYSLPKVDKFELLRQYKDGQLTDEEFFESLEDKSKNNNLFDVIDMTEDDVSTTPKKKPKKEFKMPTSFKMLLTGKELDKADKSAVVNILDSLEGEQRNEAIAFVKDLLKVEKKNNEIVRRLHEFIKDKQYNISKSYDSLLGSSIFNDEFKKEIKDDGFIKKYETVTNKATLEQAAKELDEGGQGYVLNWHNKDAQHASLIDEAVGFILLYRYQRVGDYESAVAVAQKLKEMGTSAGQSVQIFSILGRFDPDMMVVYAQKELADALDKAREDRTKRWLQKNAEKFKLTADDIEFIRRRTLQAAQLPEGRTRNVTIAEIAQRLRDKLPPQRGQSIKAYQRVCMLLNAKTNIRNAMSNAVSAPVFMYQDLFGTAVDVATSYYAQMKGFDAQRTTSVFGRGGIKENIKSFGRGAYESYDDFRRHINTRQTDSDRYKIEGQGKSFNENTDNRVRNAVAHTFNELDRLTSFLLDLGDRPFYEMWFTNSLNNQLKVNKVTAPTPQMIEIATQEALDRTWQNDNAWTRSAKRAKQLLNEFNLNKIGLQTDYGIGDVIIKFTKTPANLARAIWQFSPAGLVQSVASDCNKFRQEIKKGNYDPILQKKMVDGIAKGIAGTTIQILLYALASLGYITLTGGNDDDKDVRSFENYIMGMPEYSIKIGNKYYSYEWLQPTGAFMASIADYMNEKEKNPDNEWYENVKVALESGGDVLMRQSFVQGIQDFFEAEGFVNKFVEAALGDPSVFVPQLLSQTANVFDDKKRVVYTNDVWESMFNSVIYKIPGLRNTLEEDVDVLGREIENSQHSVFNAFFNPANTYTDTSNDVADEVYRIYEQTGDKTVFPRKAANSVTIKGVTLSLNTKQKAEFQSVMGSVSNNIIDEALDSKSYEKMTDEQKAEFVADIYSYAAAKAKSQVLTSYEALSAMYGKNVLTEEYYNRINDKVRRIIAEEYFMDSYAKAFSIESNGGSVAEYYIDKILHGKKSNSDDNLKKELDKIVKANS